MFSQQPSQPWDRHRPTAPGRIELPPEDSSAEVFREFFVPDLVARRVIVTPDITIGGAAGDSQSGFLFIVARLHNAEPATINEEYWLGGESDHVLQLGKVQMRAIACSGFFPITLFSYEVITETSRPRTFQALLDTIGTTREEIAALKIRSPADDWLGGMFTV